MAASGGKSRAGAAVFFFVPPDSHRKKQGGDRRYGKFALPALFSGALITETLFGIRGIGYTSYYAMINGDIPFTMFYLAFISILTLLANLLADVLYAVVDPRVRVH